MIVRVLTEGQYELEDDVAAQAQELDQSVVDAIQAGDEQRFHKQFSALIDLVRRQGAPVADDDLRQSELMLPPSDSSFEEAKEEFTAEGLIPE
jgi:hypothetical protein